MGAPTMSHRVPYAILRIAAVFAAYLAVQIAVMALTRSAVAAAAAGAILMVPAYLAYRRLTCAVPVPKGTPARLWLAPAATSLSLVWLSGQAAAVWAFGAWPQAAAGYREHTAAMDSAPAWLALLLSLALAPVAEELLMRGVLYRELRGSFRMPVWAAGLISAALFALLHGNTVQMAATFLLGLVLALVYEASGNILVPVAGHMLFNLAALVVPAAWIAPLATPGAVIFLAVAALLNLAALAAAHHRAAPSAW